jgi:CubicO group peptidase (beta-lactamase class C family)
LSAGEFLAKLGSLPLQYQPGTKWDYSLGLDVTGLVIEAITSQRLGQYLQGQVLEPLGMVDTSFAVPVSKVGRLAKPFQKGAMGKRDPTSPRGHDGGGGGAFWRCRAPGAGVAGIMGSAGDYNWGGVGGTYFWVDPKEELTVVLMECASPQARGHMRQLITTLVYASLEN